MLGVTTPAIGPTAERWWQGSRLTDDPAYDGEPAWSPDGRSLALGCSRGDHQNIYLANLARGGGVSPATVVGALVVAALANTLVKCGMVVATAGARMGPGSSSAGASGSGARRCSSP